MARERAAIPSSAPKSISSAGAVSVPTSEEDLAFLPVHRLAALIRAREITPSELTEIYLGRLKRLDPVLLCAVTILEGRAREEARQADLELAAGDWRGPLHGIPYGIKDLFAVAGTRTTWGSAEFSGQFTRLDSEVAVRLREAGAVLVAKLATGEFARGDRWYRGRTLNPWNLDEGSSGSSAGPGSATAAACVAFAIGTETQGSIVSPARRCGLTALRPTFGRVSRYGGMVLSWSMDKTGPMCRSALDCALVFNSIHGADEKDPGSLTAPFRLRPRPRPGGPMKHRLHRGRARVVRQRAPRPGRRPAADARNAVRGGPTRSGVESSRGLRLPCRARRGAASRFRRTSDEAERRRRSRFRGSRDVTRPRLRPVPAPAPDPHEADGRGHAGLRHVRERIGSGRTDQPDRTSGGDRPVRLWRAQSRFGQPDGDAAHHNADRRSVRGR